MNSPVKTVPVALHTATSEEAISTSRGTFISIPLYRVPQVTLMLVSNLQPRANIEAALKFDNSHTLTYTSNWLVGACGIFIAYAIHVSDWYQAQKN